MIVLLASLRIVGCEHSIRSVRAIAKAASMAPLRRSIEGSPMFPSGSIINASLVARGRHTWLQRLRPLRAFCAALPTSTVG